MSEERGPNWAAGIFAVGLFFVLVAVITKEWRWLWVASPVLIFVSVAVARGRAGPDPREERPWRSRRGGS